MVEKRCDAKWSIIQMQFEYQTVRLFEYWANGCHLVFLSNGLVFEWSVYYKEQSTKTDHLNTTQNTTSHYLVSTGIQGLACTLTIQSVLRSIFVITGVLDKNQYGATQFSLVHAFFELYGGEYSGKLQSSFSKLFTNFLHTEGFTLGVKDILVTDDANKERRNVTEETNMIGNIFT